MNIEAYLQSKRDQLRQKTRLVKNFSVFDFNHVPDQPIMRTECGRLIDAMLRFDLAGIPTHHAIIGSRGSGKTLTLRFLERAIPQQTDLTVLYANCRTHNTSFKVFAHLLGVHARGASLSELYERFMARYSGKTIVVLDEVDLMSAKDRRREILYLLSRSAMPYMVVMLSNNPQILKDIDAATISSLQPEVVHFRNYNAEQICQILLDRATRGLHKWDEAVLSEIAALTTRKTNADARVAIKALYYQVTEGEEVAACFERARRDIVVDVINDLSDSNLMILHAAATGPSEFAKDIYRRYSRISLDHQEKPFSYVYFYSNLSYLQSVGLIALVSAKVGRAYTNRILLGFDRDILDQIWKLRLGSH